MNTDNSPSLSSRYVLLAPIFPNILHVYTDAMMSDGVTPIQGTKGAYGQDCIFATAPDLDTIAAFCEKADIDGPVVEYSTIYDIQIEVETITRETVVV
jgi:hypothetical protein